MNHEVLIVGGSHAGLSAAVTLGRLLRTALVCDDGNPRNKVAKHANNIPALDGISPNLWREKARENLKKYKTISFFQGAVKSIVKKENGFEAVLSSGERRNFRKVILAFGVKDVLPLTPGFKELWGSAVFHCPFCHGFEFQGNRLGLVANGGFAEHMAPLLLGLSSDVMVFTNGKSEISGEHREHLARHRVKIVEEKIVELKHSGETLHEVLLESGSAVKRDGLLVAPIGPVQFKSDLGEQLRLEKNEMGYYKIFEMGMSSVSGVMLAGDMATPMHSVVNATAMGQMAGARAVSELLSEDFKK